MPVIVVDDDSYEAASRFADLTVKIQPSDVRRSSGASPGGEVCGWDAIIAAADEK